MGTRARLVPMLRAARSMLSSSLVGKRALMKGDKLSVAVLDRKVMTRNVCAIFGGEENFMKCCIKRFNSLF